MPGRRLAGALLLGLALAAGRAGALVLAGPPFELPAAAADIEVQGGVAYLTSTAGLQVLDVSDPGAAPVPLGSLPAPMYAGYEIEIRGSRLYLAAGDHGLRILDVTDPANPTLLGVFEQAGTRGVEVVGSLAYVVTGTGPVHLRIVDVSDPAQPVELGSVAIDPANGNQIAVAEAEGVAFVSGDTQGVVPVAIIDVADPEAPSMIGSLEAYQVRDLEVAGGLLFAAGVHLSIFDLGTAATPALVGTIPSTFMEDIELVGNLLYAVDAINARLEVFEVSDPASPEQLGILAVRQGPFDLAVSGSHAFLTTTPIFLGDPTPPALQAVDVRRPEYPALTFIGNAARRLRVVGERLYAADARFEIYDISVPADPLLLGSGNASALPTGLEVAGGVAYLASSPGFVLRLLDVSDPALPVALASVPTPATALALRGDRLYVGTTAQVEIYDVSDPASPVRLGATPLLPGSQRPRDMDLEGSRLYVTTLLGVQIFDVGSDTAPFLSGFIDGLGFTYNSAVVGNTLYTSGSPGVFVIDVGNPAAPSVVGTVTGVAVQSDLEIAGDRLFTSGVVKVFDISAPRTPVLLGGSLFGSELETSNGVVYAAGSSNRALFAIDFGPEYLPTLEVAIDVSPFDPRNRVVITRPGHVLVGLFGSALFDVRDVDETTLGFGPGRAAARAALPLRLNRDRSRDLLSLHWIPDAEIAITDKQACLTGATLEGRRFRGCDRIQPLAGCGDGYAPALLVPLLLPLQRMLGRRTRARRARLDASA